MLAVKGSHTYVIFNYENEGLQWSGNAVIGYTSADEQFFYNHPLSQTAAVVNVSTAVDASNTGIVGKLIYHLSADGLPYTNCGERLERPIGFIVSPLYPAYYPNNANCVWRMSLETAYRIVLSFNLFALDDSDFLLLYNNSAENGSLIFNRTGQCATDPTSECRQNDFHSFIAEGFILQFKSDSFGRGKGFNITYGVHQIGQ